MRRLPFLPALEGLRGVAVLVVLLFHAEVPGAGGGFLGVSTFFTLSGFLITRLLTAEGERDGRIGLRAFWGRRLRRLMPAALVGLAAIALLASLFGDYTQLQRLREDGIAALLYSANWWLIISGAAYDDLMGSPSFIQHFWSLAIEEQYYAVFPLVAAVLLARGGRRPLAIVLGLGTLASWVWMFALGGADVATARIYYGTDTRSGELLVGGLLALLLSGRTLSRDQGRILAVLGVLGLCASAVLWTLASVESLWLYRGGLACYAIASAALIAGCVAPTGPVRLLLSLPVLRWIGRVSYGAYVYHWPIFLVVDDRTGLDPWTLFALRVGLTFALAAASHRWLEEPVLNGRRLGGWRGAVVAPLAFVAIGFSFDQARSMSVDFEGGAISVTIFSAPGVFDGPVPRVAGAPRVAVLGDSVGHDVGRGLAVWSALTGEVEVLNLAARGCGLAIGAWPKSVGRKRHGCDRWRERVRKRLLDFRPEIIVLVPAVWDLDEREKPEWGGPLALGDPTFDDWLIAEYESTVRFFEDLGAPFVLLTAPCVGNWAEEGALDPERVTHLNQSILPAVLTSKARVAKLLDLHEAVCPGGRYSNELFGIQPFRRDGIHFSELGQRWVGGWLGPQILDVWNRPRD